MKKCLKIICMASFFAGAWPLAAAPLDKLVVPLGFRISLFAEQVENARQMAVAEDGTVFVGSRSAGKLYALPDLNKDGRADRVITLAEGLSMPSGLAYRNGDLYVAEIHQVSRYKNILKQLNNPQADVVIADLPRDRHHGWKYIDFGPDGWLYVPVGAPCNVCATQSPYAMIHRYQLETGERQLVAQGVRNSVGFDWHPQSGDLWFSDNGRDMMGDDLPPCEINHVSQMGQHFGYPYVHGSDVLDPEFGQGKNPADYRAPAWNIQAHSAPLGIQFYHGNMFPSEYQHALFVAEHGSWNRSSKVGYQVTVAMLENNQIVEYRPFVTGFLQAEEQVVGRPSAILTLPDGSILIADDFADAIYRVTYQQQ